MIKKVHDVSTVELVFHKKTVDYSTWRRVFRIHQWLKNLLLFVPLFAAHDLNNGPAWISLILAFGAFNLCASSVYITNDLLDIESDRLHPRKKNRPFASGVIPLWIGTLLVPLLLMAGLGLALLVGSHLFFWILTYVVLSSVYSLLLKRLIVIDCLTLAVLYTLRMIAGAATVGYDFSFWLFAFSVFLFLSLAFVKRYAEIEIQIINGRKVIHGRGYHITDAPLIQTMGVVSGYLSALVLALYLNSDSVLKLYAAPVLIWGVVPVILFWISWMWVQANRGKMHDDPLVFAVKDIASLSAGAIFAAILIAGTIGISWLR